MVGKTREKIHVVGKVEEKTHTSPLHSCKHTDKNEKKRKSVKKERKR